MERREVKEKCEKKLKESIRSKEERSDSQTSSAAVSAVDRGDGRQLPQTTRRHHAHKGKNGELNVGHSEI